MSPPIRACTLRTGPTEILLSRSRSPIETRKPNMNRLPALLLILLAVPVMAENEQGARVGNPRAYEVDILFDTFGFTQDAIDAEVEQVFQGCPQRDCIPSIDQPQFLKTGQVDFLDEDDIVISLT